MRLISHGERVAVAHKMAVKKPARRRPAVGVNLKKYNLEAIDRRYIYLKCEHYTTPQEVELLWTFRPKKGKAKFWCGNCGKWRERMPKPKTAKIPAQPMF
jgi:hypothetical protein